MEGFRLVGGFCGDRELASSGHDLEAKLPKGFSTYLDGRLVAQRDSAEGEIPDLAAPVYFGAFNGVAEFCNGNSMRSPSGTRP